jgi:murein DD-endopeptidase MepM/ murein hydrolase activator NlpD
LRPDISQKSGTVSSKSEDRSPLVDITPVTPDAIRPSGNAAAMLGIALSIGASSFGFHGVAQAATETAPTQVSVQFTTAQEPLLTPVSTPQVAIVPQAVPQAVERPLTTPTAAPMAVTPAPVAAASDAPTAAVTPLGHAVKSGETLWQIAKSYRVEVQSLAAANNLPAAAVLKVGQVLQLPTDGGIQSAAGTVNLQAMSQSVPMVPVLAADESAVAARQDASVADLRVKRDRLKQTLAEVSPSATVTFTEGQADAAAAAAKPVQGLPVTRLANVPLPAIGGAEPEMIVQRPVELPAKAKQIAARQEVITTATAATVPVLPVSAPRDFNPTPLLAEIHSLRHRYSQKKLSETNATLVAQVVPTEPRGTRAQSVAVNPDFAARPANNSALSIELRNFVQPKLKPDAAKTKTVPTANPQVVARATLGSEAYAPVTPAVRKMVAPNLPAIGKADAYLPGGSTAGMVWPAQGMLSSGFGWRWGRAHKGIDIAAPIGTPIVAAAAGRVSYAGWNDGGYGYVVEVDHEDGRMTRYAHNDRILVKNGQQVNQGQQISEMGSTGRSTGPHLHFEVRQADGEAVNPVAFLGNQS